MKQKIFVTAILFMLILTIITPTIAKPKERRSVYIQGDGKISGEISDNLEGEERYTRHFGGINATVVISATMSFHESLSIKASWPDSISPSSTAKINLEFSSDPEIQYTIVAKIEATFSALIGQTYNETTNETAREYLEGTITISISYVITDAVQGVLQPLTKTGEGTFIYIRKVYNETGDLIGSHTENITREYTIEGQEKIDSAVQMVFLASGSAIYNPQNLTATLTSTQPTYTLSIATQRPGTLYVELKDITIMNYTLALTSITIENAKPENEDLYIGLPAQFALKMIAKASPINKFTAVIRTTGQLEQIAKVTIIIAAIVAIAVPVAIPIYRKYKTRKQ